MKRWWLALVVWSGLSMADTTGHGPTLEVLADDVWRHTTWAQLDGNERWYSSSGLVVRDGDGLTLVDTGWGEAATRDLLALIDAQIGLPIQRVVTTHAHDDRMGGLMVLHARDIDSWTSPRIQQDAARLDGPRARHVIDRIEAPGDSAQIGGIELFYPGDAHAPGNLVVWVADAGILYGGCAIRDAGGRNLGYIGDADVAGWSAAMQRVIDRYPDVRVVVPGHGEPGDPGLLRHTLELAEAGEGFGD